MEIERWWKRICALPCSASHSLLKRRIVNRVKHNVMAKNISLTRRMLVWCCSSSWRRMVMMWFVRLEEAPCVFLTIEVSRCFSSVTCASNRIWKSIFCFHYIFTGLLKRSSLFVLCGHMWPMQCHDGFLCVTPAWCPAGAFYFRFVGVQIFWNFHLPDVLLELVAEGPQLGHVCLQPLLLFFHLIICKS